MQDAATDITINLIRRSGIKPGMHILDVGCGPGEVSFLLAEYLGEDGTVTGVDRNEKALSLAEETAKERAIRNVSFVKGDLIPDAIPEQGYDAAFGRRVIMYQPDAVASLSRIASVVKPGGIIAFQEHDSDNGPSLASTMPLHAKIRGWLRDMIINEGGNPNIGRELYSVFSQAGLNNIDVRAEAIVVNPDYDAKAPFILKMVWSRLLDTGVINEEEQNLEMISRQLDEERKSSMSAAVWDMAYQAIAVK